MTTIKSTREIYSKIPVKVPEEPKVLEPNQELMDRTIEKLNPNPIFTPKVK